MVTDEGFGQTVSVPFAAAAQRLGLQVTGVYAFQPKAKGYAALARRVAR